MTEEKPPPRDARLFAWLRRVNTERAAVLMWIGLCGMILGFALNRPEVLAAFGGLIPMSLAIGKDK